MHLVYNGTSMRTSTIILLALLSGCAKTAGESIAYTAHQQLNAIEQSIKPECMTASTAEQIKALHSTITSQLSNCELAQSKLKSDITKWQVISVALFGALLVLLYIKILRK